ncbi:hypothetical protein [Novipirellula sp.]|uniref:hypothetical protein n=1 Tax=Novipirellula sp. TaxID=2795430 RepID=UPI003569DB17
MLHSVTFAGPTFDHRCESDVVRVMSRHQHKVASGTVAVFDMDRPGSGQRAFPARNPRSGSVTSAVPERCIAAFRPTLSHGNDLGHHW